MCAKKEHCVISQWSEDFLSKRLECGDNVASRTSSCVKASGEVAVFISSLKERSYLLKIVSVGLDVLELNVFAGGEG
jgi:hypothetical protein